MRRMQVLQGRMTSEISSLMSRVERPICVVKSALPKGKDKCLMALPVSVLAAKISSTTWELPLSLNTPVSYFSGFSDL